MPYICKVKTIPFHKTQILYISVEIFTAYTQHLPTMEYRLTEYRKSLPNLEEHIVQLKTCKNLTIYSIANKTRLAYITAIDMIRNDNKNIK